MLRVQSPRLLLVWSCTNEPRRLPDYYRSEAKPIRVIMLVSTLFKLFLSDKFNHHFISALIFPPGLDLICAFYGCLYVGCVPVTIRPPHPQNLATTLPTVRMIVEVSRANLILAGPALVKLLRSREATAAAATPDARDWKVRHC